MVKKESVLKMKKFNLKKITVVASSFVLFGGGVAVGAMHQTSPRVQANATKNHILHAGDTYKLDGLSLRVSEYNYKGSKNIVITTNLKQKEFYRVGSNDDKHGKTRGVTVAFGNDQK